MFPDCASRSRSFSVLLLIVAAATITLAGATRLAAADWPTDPATNVVVHAFDGAGGGDLWVVPDGAGGFVFSLLLRPGYETDTWGGRVDNGGQTLWWSYFGARQPIGGWTADYRPVLAPDDAGGAFLTWIDVEFYSGDVCVQHWINGTRAWPFSGSREGVALTSQGSQGHSYSMVTPVADATGGAVVAWCDQLTGGHRAQRVGTNGFVRWTAEGVPLGSPPNGWPFWLDVVPDGRGGAIVLVANGTTVFAQRVDSTGAVRWAPGWVNLSATSQSADAYNDADPFYRRLKAVSDGAGGAVAVWTDYRSDTPGSGDIYAQRVDSTGAVRWGSAGAAVCVQPLEQSWPRTAPDGTGGVIVTWQDWRSGTNWDIYAQRIDGTGAARWTTNGIPVCTAPGHQIMPAIAAVPSGGAVVAWRDPRSNPYYDIYAQYVDGDGDLHWLADGAPVSTAPESKLSPSVVSDGAEGGIVVWIDDRGVCAQRTPVSADVPVLVSLVSAEAEAGLVRVTWQVADPAQAFTIERRAATGTWQERGRASADGTGRIVVEDREVIPGQRYGYRLAASSAPDAVRFGEVWVDVPLAARFALHGARPNPSAGPLAVSFSLAEGGRATLELLDLAGRRLLSRDLSGLGPGEHLLSLGASSPLAPGLYLARLTQPGHMATAKVLITR